MRVVVIVAALCAMLGWSLPARAEGPAGPVGAEGAIKSVIERQLQAFQANDLETAFGFASPTIQRKFATPENFGRMVQQGYPMVWRPARYRMVRLVETAMGLVQVVMFEDAAGRLHEAAYLMRQVDGVWRIDGVQLRRMPGVGT